MAIPLSRRPGSPFDAFEAETFCQERAGGSSIPVAAERAGITKAAGLKLEQAPEVRDRVRELRSGNRTMTTVSKAWVLEQLRVNVERSVSRAEQAEDKDYGKIMATANDALKLCLEVLKKDGDVLDTPGFALPANTTPDEFRDHLRRQLSPPQEPIVIPQPQTAVEAE